MMIARVVLRNGDRLLLLPHEAPMQVGEDWELVATPSGTYVLMRPSRAQELVTKTK